MEAPLSSPALSGPPQHHYFTRSSTSTSNNSTSSSSTSLSSHSQAFASRPQNAPQTQTQYQTHPASSSHQQCPQQQQQQGGNTTTPFLRDFNLVAEAAKRAQMAVLMRDFESVGL